jgi:hypothetical protein
VDVARYVFVRLAHGSVIDVLGGLTVTAVGEGAQETVLPASLRPPDEIVYYATGIESI